MNPQAASGFTNCRKHSKNAARGRRYRLLPGRVFFASSLYGFACFACAVVSSSLAADLHWIQTARVFLIDAYQPPFAPKFEYDAEALAKTMVEMHANTVRIATMGKYATIQGVRFSRHPDLGTRDVLAETIAACKPRGIRTVALHLDRA